MNQGGRVPRESGFGEVWAGSPDVCVSSTDSLECCMKVGVTDSTLSGFPSFGTTNIWAGSFFGGGGCAAYRRVCGSIPGLIHSMPVASPPPPKCDNQKYHHWQCPLGAEPSWVRTTEVGESPRRQRGSLRWALPGEAPSKTCPLPL